VSDSFLVGSFSKYHFGFVSPVNGNQRADRRWMDGWMDGWIDR